MEDLIAGVAEPQRWAIALCACFIVLDMVSGTAKAAKAHELSSSVAREGMWHKAGYVLIVVVAALIELAQAHIDLGFTVPLVVPACAIIILTEIFSIYENAAALNPEIRGLGLSKLFGIGKDGDGQ